MLQIKLTQAAYISNNSADLNECFYTAQAVAITPNEEGDFEEYKVRWDITNPTAENEDECCDWGKYDVYCNGLWVQNEVQIINNKFYGWP